MQKGTIYERWIRTSLIDTRLMPETNLFTYQHINLAINDLANGIIDVVVMDYIPAEKLITGGTMKIVGQDLNQQQYAIATGKYAPELQAKLNTALAQLQTEGVVTALAKHYFDLDEVPAVPTPLPTSIPPSLIPPPTATPPGQCVDGMQFVEDLNYDDNDMTTPPVIQPGTPFTKGWRIRNTGTCTWNNAYLLKYVGGNSPQSGMGGAPTPIQQAVPPGGTYDIYVNLVSPAQPGIYQGFWSLHNASGVALGDRIWVGISVPSLDPATPTPVPGAPQIQRFTVNAYEITLGSCVTLNWQVNGQADNIVVKRNKKDLISQAPLQGSFEDCPGTAGEKNYQIIATGPGGTAQAQETVNVTEQPVPTTPPSNPPQIASFTVLPATISAGEIVNISWKVTGDYSVINIYRNGAVIMGNAPDDYSIADRLDNPGTYVYRIDATDNQGQGDAQEISVTVTQNPDVPTPPITGPVWTLTGYFDNTSGTFTPALPGVNTTAQFDDEGNLTGNTGCNSYTANYQLQGDLIAISNIITSKKTCTDPAGIMQMETNFLQNLSATVKVTVDQNNKLILYNSVNQELLEFIRR